MPHLKNLKSRSLEMRFPVFWTPKSVLLMGIEAQVLVHHWTLKLSRALQFFGLQFIAEV